MPLIHYHASQEQWSPADLLRFACDAEDAGFDGVFSSDHLQPWSPAQGHSGATWSWLAAALQATRRLCFGTITVPCGWRYHPVMLAQSLGTLGVMFPGRVPWIALGSGEALNEAHVADEWPEKAERNRRLLEGARQMRRLLRGERVSHAGQPRVDDARVWERAAEPPRLVGAAMSVETAEWLGGWADGLYTVAASPAALAPLIEAFHRGGGSGKPIHVKVDVSWAATDELALTQAHAEWASNVVGGVAASEWRHPEDFEKAARRVQPHELRRSVLVASDPARHVEHLQGFAALGVESIDIHAVAGDQRRFIEMYGRDVLPLLASGGSLHRRR